MYYLRLKAAGFLPKSRRRAILPWSRPARLVLFSMVMIFKFQYRRIQNDDETLGAVMVLVIVKAETRDHERNGEEAASQDMPACPLLLTGLLWSISSPFLLHFFLISGPFLRCLWYISCFYRVHFWRSSGIVFLLFWCISVRFLMPSM